MMEAALALLAVSAPITAAIIKFVPSNGNGNGKYVTYREFTAHTTHVKDRLDRIESGLVELLRRTK